MNDPTAARYSLYDADGRFLMVYPRRIPGHTFRWFGGVDSAERIYDWTFTVGPYSREPGLQESHAENFALRMDPALAAADSVALPFHGEPYYRARGGTSSIPFQGSFLWTIDAGGHVWLTHTDAYRICQLSERGDTLLIVERAYEPLPVTGAERAAAITGLERWMEGRGGGKVDLDYSVIPSVHPAIEGFDLDDRGNLWVRPVTKHQTTSFDIYDATGRLMATATADRRIYPFRPVRISGGSAWFVISDSLDVDYVVRAVIER